MFPIDFKEKNLKQMLTPGGTSQMSQLIIDKNVIKDLTEKCKAYRKDQMILCIFDIRGNVYEETP